MRRLLLITLVVGSFASCDRFKDATHDECEAAVEHVIELQVKEGAGDDALAGMITRGIGRWALKKTGDYEAAIKKCMVEATKADIKCVLRCDTMAEINSCGNNN